MSYHGKGVGVYTKMSGSGAASFVIADQPDPEIVQNYPFKVTVFKDGGTVGYRVRAGTVNNIVPKIGDTFLDALDPPFGTFDGDGTWYIFLRSSNSSPPIFFPGTIVVDAFSTEQADSDAAGHLKIASVVVADGKPGPVNQFVYASQVLVRVKPGSATAIYSWSSR